MAHRKNVSTLSNPQLTQLRALLDQFINKPNNNPVAEHKAAGMDMSLMIHDMGLLTWHQHFIAELETWLANNGGEKFVPLLVAALLLKLICDLERDFSRRRSRVGIEDFCESTRGDVNQHASELN